jgi:hypothetical protein
LLFLLKRGRFRGVTRLSRSTVLVRSRGAAASVLVVVPPCALGVVGAEAAAGEGGGVELLHGADGRLDVGEVGVGEAAGPARVAVDGDADVGHVVELAEHAVQLGVGRLVGDVANVERVGGLGGLAAALAERAALLAGGAVVVVVIVSGAKGSVAAGVVAGDRLAHLHVDAAAVPEGLVRFGHGGLGRCRVVKGDKGETG